LPEIDSAAGPAYRYAMTAETAAPPNDAARLVFLAGAAITLSHLANEWVDAPIPAGPAWKCVGIVVLGVYAAMRKAWLPMAGFFFCAAGDVLLELKGLFVFGMAAFGLAHVFYTAEFVRIVRREGVHGKGWPLASVVLAISVGLAVYLVPAMGGLTVPAIAYQIVISIMAVAALMSKAPTIAKIGAAAFMVSDTLIAVNMFRELPLPPGSVWLTYASAQIMLAVGFTRIRLV
jgi:uncharacterized membrane protein YhhN